MKGLTEDDFDTKSKVVEKVGEELMNMDKLAFDLLKNLPSVNTEMRLRQEIDVQNRIYIIFIIISFLLITSILMFTYS